LTFVCRCCDFREQVTEFENTDSYMISRKDLKTQKLSVFNDPEYALDPTMMRTREVNCPECGHNEAVFFPTADKNESKILKVYICANVNEHG